jgi:hypothetical protein
MTNAQLFVAVLAPIVANTFFFFLLRMSITDLRDEMNRRFDDVHKRIDDLRDTMNTRFDDLHKRFDDWRGFVRPADDRGTRR